MIRDNKFLYKRNASLNKNASQSGCLLIETNVEIIHLSLNMERWVGEVAVVTQAIAVAIDLAKAGMIFIGFARRVDASKS